VTPHDHFDDATAVGGGSGVTTLSEAVRTGVQARKRRRNWAFASEGAHPGSALEWWFFQGSVSEISGNCLDFMVSFIRHEPETDADLRDHGHAPVLTVLESNASRHQASSWVDEAAVQSVAGQPRPSSATNVDRRLLDAFFEEIRTNGPPRGVARTRNGPRFRPDPLDIEWDDLRIEHRGSHIHLAFSEPDGGRPWNLRLDPACSRMVLETACQVGKKGHGMEMVSYPRLAASGEVGSVAVSGTAWFDHQWGGLGWFFADGRSGRVLGWEWLGINLDDGRDVIIGVHRDAETGAVTDSHAYLRENDPIEQCAGGVEMVPLRFWHSPRTLIRYAVSWRARVPALAIDLRYEPVVDDQEVPMFGLARAIWEGAGRVVGTVRGQPVTGRARGEFFGSGYVFEFRKHLDAMRKRIDDHIEGFLPPVLEASHLERYIGSPRWRHELDAYSEMLTDPVWDLVSRRGKRWRPLFGMLMLDALGCDPSPYEELMSVLAELLHTGALIIDDIQDRSLLRRGDECIHLRYGEEVAISAANTLYFLPSVLVSEHPLLTQAQRLAVHETTAEHLRSAHLGQALDIYWSRNMDPEHLGRWMGDSLEAKILQMYAQKTSAPLVALAKIASVFSNADRQSTQVCVDFARDLGVGYQVVDDIQNFSTSPEWRKTCGEDLAEGKMTMVLYHALRRLQGPERRRLEEILCTPDVRRSPEGLAEGVDLARRSGALEVCRNRAEQIVGGSWRAVSECLPPSESKILLRTLWGALLDQELPV
jgi:geranylgeranyl pyrophosphate synthase/predicted secreted hydrolase